MMKGVKYISTISDMVKAKKKIEELEKFLQDRLSEDDFKKFTMLFKELMVFSLDKVKAFLEEFLESEK